MIAVITSQNKCGHLGRSTGQLKSTDNIARNETPLSACCVVTVTTPPEGPLDQNMLEQINIMYWFPVLVLNMQRSSFLRSQEEEESHYCHVTLR